MSIVARYDGTCPDCGRPIDAGVTKIDPAKAGPGWVHAICPKHERRPTPVDPRPAAATPSQQPAARPSAYRTAAEQAAARRWCRGQGRQEHAR